LEDVFLFLIKPLQSHLSVFQSKLLKVDQTEAVLEGSIEDLINEFFASLVFDGKNNPARAQELARVFN